MLEIVFWFSFLILIYTYIGYGVILYGLISIKRFFYSGRNDQKAEKFVDLPEVTFLVAAYNEEREIEQKLVNTSQLEYPIEKFHAYFITDGSTDSSMHLIQKFIDEGHHNFKLFHKDERQGKTAAIERVMPLVQSPIIIFSDANTLVNKMGVHHIVKHYRDPKVGAVAGEKRVNIAGIDDASSAGEGFYWKYESTLKRWDAELYSVVGAAGELFSIRRSLHENLPENTIIEDFHTTLRIAQRGYKVAYAPDAYALENASLSVGEELKRKIRIAAGGLQAIYRLAPLLNVFRFGVLSFQYISHRVLRWTLAPLALLVLLITNIILLGSEGRIYRFLFIAQLGFYFLAFLGFLLERKKIKLKAFFIPYYFCIMNYAVFLGFFRIISNQQTVRWEKVKRK